ncbi:MAG: hypothetical protein WA040_25345 [Anaerolineae bacterium]
METILLQPQLMEQVVLVASQESRKPDELVESAVRDYLRGMQRKKIEAEVRAYESMHLELVRTHLGRYVALHSGKLVDVDEDFQMLHQRVRQRFGNEAVLIRRVEAMAQPELLFRSPRFEAERS